MGIRNDFSWGILFVLVTFVFVGGTQAKALFSIDSHSYTHPLVNVYTIEGDTLACPVRVNDLSDFVAGVGPIDIAVSDDLNLAFVTFEDTYDVVVLSTRTLERVALVQTLVYDAAGIVADDVKDKIYIIRRGTHNLYVYTWNEITETLDLESQQDLSGLTSGKGIALDGEYLYVTDTSDTVRCYNTTTWAHDDSNDITLPEDNGAWGIAIYHDSLDNRYGYFGGLFNHDNLVRVDLDDPNNYLIITPSDSGVSGLAVDPNTGLVYASLLDHTNRVFDTSFKDFKQIREGCFGIYAAGPSPGDKFCDIHPPIGCFAIVDIALGFTEYFSDLTLRKSRIYPHLPKIAGNQTVFRTVLGFCCHNINLSSKGLDTICVSC